MTNSMQQINRKIGFAWLIQIARAKKWWLFASIFLAVLARFIPVIAVIIS